MTVPPRPPDAWLPPAAENPGQPQPLGPPGGNSSDANWQGRPGTDSAQGGGEDRCQGGGEDNRHPGGEGNFHPGESRDLSPATESSRPTPTAPRHAAPPSHTRLIVLLAILVFAVAAVGAFTAQVLRHNAPAPTAEPAPSVTSTPPPTTEPSPTPTPEPMPDRPVEPFPDVTPAGFADPPPGQGLQRYLDQVIEWVPCAAGSVEGDCADILVPLDYADPDGQAITLAVFKRPPADGVGAMGPLFVNPGGPGTPGRGVAAWLDAASLPGYSLVGWDPRGVGASTPVVCDTDLDALRALDASPDDAAEEEAFVDGWRAFDQSCLAQSGRLLQHVGTADTVADLDLLRALLGADRLNYLGYSYGTAIGALYAQTYPDKVGRMVLDSPVNITDNDSVSQAAGFDVAFGNFADWCVESGCRLATPGMATGADLVTATIAWLDALDQVPVPVGDRFLTQSLASDGLALYLYQDASAYLDLADALGEAEVGDGAALLEAADGLWERNDDGSYSPALGAFTAIRCVDGTDSGLAGAFAEWRKEAAEAPLFGGSAGLDVACEVWPVRASLDDVTITAAGAAPILVVGATGDSATPYEYAQWMEEQMPSARLLTYDGPGHATYGGRNDCVDTTVNTYLNEGTLPPKGTVCAA